MKIKKNFRINANEFIEEVKEELFSTSEITDDKINEWESKFVNLYKKNNFKTIYVDGFDLKLQDESDIFQISDGFWSAVVNNEEKKYWDSI